MSAVTRFSSQHFCDVCQLPASAQLEEDFLPRQTVRRLITDSFPVEDVINQEVREHSIYRRPIAAIMFRELKKNKKLNWRVSGCC